MHPPSLLLASLWSSSRPELLSALLVAVVLILGGVLVARLLADEPQAEEGDPWLATELERVRAARDRATAAIRTSEGSVRGSLGTLIAGPLSACDERVQAIASALRSLTRQRAASPPTGERRQLLESLARETDPRARQLLSASLADLDQVDRAQSDLESRARLARLELSRLRTLLEGLPERIRELESRRAFGEQAQAEVVAEQLEAAVTRTSEQLVDLLGQPDPLHLDLQGRGPPLPEQST